MKLNLPFAYALEPQTTRGRSGVRARLRGDVAVDVPEIAGRFLDRAFVVECADGSTDTIWLTPDGKLVAPVFDLAGVPVSGTALAPILDGPGHPSGAHVLGQLLASDDEREAEAVLALPKLDLRRAGRGRGSIGPRAGGFEDARAAASARYSASVVLVEGVVHRERTEPAWRVRRRGDAPAISPVLRPGPTDAVDLFSHGREMAADLWAARWLGEIPCPSGGIAMHSAPALRRDDLTELVRLTRSPIAAAWMRDVDSALGEEARAPALARLASLTDADQVPAFRGPRTVAYLDAFCDAYGWVLARSNDASAEGSLSTLRWIAERWRFEKELVAAEFLLAATRPGTPSH